ncbi:hypothetical protein [Pontibacter vulgaris]|uniref:hypothetical protein n=1 Tax=Pontibacter vulgaris TaxID=2905679 RepID=UPI001FA6EAE3|nr:hypothetical protein [Pontibacter vulgaris]
MRYEEDDYRDYEQDERQRWYHDEKNRRHPREGFRDFSNRWQEPISPVLPHRDRDFEPQHPGRFYNRQEQEWPRHENWQQHQPHAPWQQPHHQDWERNRYNQQPEDRWAEHAPEHLRRQHNEHTRDTHSHRNRYWRDDDRG